MHNEKADSAATADKSHGPVEGYAARFQAQIEQWRKDGCPHKTRDAADNIVTCGAAPNLVRQSPPTPDGKVSLFVSCADGHADVFEFVVDVAEIKAEASKQQAAMRGAEADAEPPSRLKRDPMVAEIRISMNLATQEVKIDPWVPTPLVGLGMLAIAQKSFFDQMGQQERQRKDGLVVPEKKILSPQGTALN